MLKMFIQAVATLTTVRSWGCLRLHVQRGRSVLAVTLSALFAFVFLLAPLAHAEADYLQPEDAFKFSARMADAKTIEIKYTIAGGYYMYRERFRFKAVGVKLGEPILPAGKVKFDDTFQKNVETYRNTLTIKIPVEAESTFTLTATGQGCADKGLCYAPMDSEAKLSPGGMGLLGAVAAAQKELTGNGVVGEPRSGRQVSSPGMEEAADAVPSADSEMGRIEASLKSGELLVILPLFFLLGLGLSFTPCVLPMVPILSFIIVGEGAQVRPQRGFLLSVTYSLGMAIVYTGLGIAAGLIGEGLSATLQNPWVLGAFALLMVALSLSMFGVYQLQVPAAIQLKLIQASEKQATGKLLGVFMMGAISALIVGPCVAAPLAGALVYISQTRDVLVGGGALFAMAVGMSVPLLLVGLSAGSLLPRAGAWMESVKRFFGILMLGVALWLLAPVIPAWVQLSGWAALGIGYGTYMLWTRETGWLAKALGLVFVAFGLAQLLSVATGGRDALAPLAHLKGSSARKTEFVRVKSVAELDAALTQSNGKIVLLDFYADWCVSCLEMEKLTFSDSRIQAQFGGMVLLQIDVTANNVDDKAMLKRFNLFGPPGIIFFNKQGREIQGARVIGYQNAEKFLRSLAFISSI